MDMHDHIKERADLAHTYACDGAYSRAATILEELAVTVRAHAVERTAMSPGSISPDRKHTVERQSNGKYAVMSPGGGAVREFAAHTNAQRLCDELNANH